MSQRPLPPFTHYTDKQLAELLPTWPLERRIEEILRKYIGGIMSSACNGDNASDVADALMARALLRRLRPWLRSRPDTPEEP